MDKYWSKVPEVASKMMDKEMDDYWKKKDEVKEDDKEEGMLFPIL